MRVPNWVCVPYTDRVDLTGPLVESLLDDPKVDRLLLWDNGSTDRATLTWQERLSSAGGRVQVRRRPRIGQPHEGRPWSLYGCWNGTRAEALASGPANLVALNNDLTVPDRFVTHLAGALRAADDDVWIVYPNAARPLSYGVEPEAGLTRTRGLWPDGMTGFALAMKAEAPVPDVDERFVFYCGDVDLVWQVQMAGGTAARVEGLPVSHLVGGTRKRGRWHDVIAADRALREVKYPHGPWSVP